MKLRQIPDDFIVEEIPNKQWKSEGKFAVYKLSKVGLTTFAAEKILAKKLEVKFNKLGFAGLKDAHARTVQYFSAEVDDPQKGVFKEKNVTSELVGFLDEQMRTGDLTGNKFIITVRELKDEDVEIVEKNAEAVSQGVPNYFDSQRFGSLRGTTGFIAKDILRGDFESAVKKVLTATTKNQKGIIRKSRKFIAANWGNWEACLKLLEELNLTRTSEAAMVAHLAQNKDDFKGAFRRVFAGIRQLFFSAYQSYIWNECVKQLVRKTSKEVFSVEYEAGKLVFPRGAWPLEDRHFPMVAGDMATKGEDGDMIKHVLKTEGVQLVDFFTDEHTFVARDRHVRLHPIELTVESAEDERCPGKLKVVLTFGLPKGSYATIITKALFEK